MKPNLLKKSKALQKAYSIESDPTIDDETKKLTEEYFKQQEETLKTIKAEADKIKNFTPEEMSEWLIEQHRQYVTTIDYTVQQNWIDGNNSESRYMISTYIYNLFQFLDIREIEFLDNKVADILAAKGESDLVLILHVLGYF